MHKSGLIIKKSPLMFKLDKLSNYINLGVNSTGCIEVYIWGVHIKKSVEGLFTNYVMPRDRWVVSKI